MGFLDNSSVTVDAILTKRGRELLAEGRDKFSITQFALADDEVDYDLWNPAHSLGSDYYGIVIENMPILEAITDDSYLMKYKLLSLPKSTVKLPFIELSVTSISSAEEGTASTINVTTKNGGNENLGYTAILLNSDVGSISGNAGVPGTTSPIININSYATNQALAVTGLNSFIFTPTNNLPTNQTTNTRIIIIGNETGGRAELDVTVTPKVNE
jgi:hypothetical protein|tara:strand:- start:3856 stop:4497 length:642 start_codon:yes stop_codon:yes gene_type:complete